MQAGALIALSASKCDNYKPRMNVINVQPINVYRYNHNQIQQLLITRIGDMCYVDGIRFSDQCELIDDLTIKLIIGNRTVTEIPMSLILLACEYYTSGQHIVCKIPHNSIVNPMNCIPIVSLSFHDVYLEMNINTNIQLEFILNYTYLDIRERHKCALDAHHYVGSKIQKFMSPKKIKIETNLIFSGLYVHTSCDMSTHNDYEKINEHLYWRTIERRYDDIIFSDDNTDRSTTTCKDFTIIFDKYFVGDVYCVFLEDNIIMGGMMGPMHATDLNINDEY